MNERNITFAHLCGLATNVGRIPFESFRPHVVVHLLLHVDTLGEGLGLVRDKFVIKGGNLVEVIESIRLVIAKGTNRIAAKVRIGEGQGSAATFVRSERERRVN